jgi:plasmid stability protein
MATLTIPNVPEDLVERIRSVAVRNDRSVEQEVRLLIIERFGGKDEAPVPPQGSKEEALIRIRERWKDPPRDHT